MPDINQKAVTIWALLDPASVINAEIAAGWRLTHLTPIASTGFLVIFRRDPPDAAPAPKPSTGAPTKSPKERGW